MKKHKLLRKLKKAGCYNLNRKTSSAHEMWYSPITNHSFPITDKGEYNLGYLETLEGQSGVILRPQYAKKKNKKQ